MTKQDNNNAVMFVKMVYKSIERFSFNLQSICTSLRWQSVLLWLPLYVCMANNTHIEPSGKYVTILSCPLWAFESVLSLT